MAIQCTHTTSYTRTTRSIAACSPAYNLAHHSNGIFTSSRSLQHAQRSTGQRNPTESSTPLGFILARPKELTACCSACASAYAPPAARSPACTARLLQHAQRSTGQCNPTESRRTPLGFILARPKELTAYYSACASAYAPLHLPLARPHTLHVCSNMLTGPSVHATQPCLRLLSRRLWNSERVIAIVHAQPATSLSLPCPQPCPYLN